MGVSGHADIMSARIGDKITGRATPGFIHKSRLGTDDLARHFFILNPPQEEIGQIQPVRMFGCRLRLITMGTHHVTADFILHRRLHNHRHTLCRTIILVVINTDHVGEVRVIRKPQFLHFLIHQRNEGLHFIRVGDLLERNPGRCILTGSHVLAGSRILTGSRIFAGSRILAGSCVFTGSRDLATCFAFTRPHTPRFRLAPPCISGEILDALRMLT